MKSNKSSLAYPVRGLIISGDPIPTVPETGRGELNATVSQADQVSTPGPVSRQTTGVAVNQHGTTKLVNCKNATQPKGGCANKSGEVPLPFTTSTSKAAPALTGNKPVEIPASGAAASATTKSTKVPASHVSIAQEKAVPESACRSTVPPQANSSGINKKPRHKTPSRKAATTRRSALRIISRLGSLPADQLTKEQAASLSWARFHMATLQSKPPTVTETITEPKQQPSEEAKSASASAQQATTNRPKLATTTVSRSVSEVVHVNPFRAVIADAPNDNKKYSRPADKNDLEHLIKSNNCVALVNNIGHRMRPVNKAHWPMINTNIANVMNTVVRPNTPIARFEPAGTYRGFLLIKCDSNLSKRIFRRCLGKIRFIIKGMRLTIIQANEINSIFENKSPLNVHKIKIEKQTTHALGNSTTGQTVKSIFQQQQGFQNQLLLNEPDVEIAQEQRTHGLTNNIREMEKPTFQQHQRFQNQLLPNEPDVEIAQQQRTQGLTNNTREMEKPTFQQHQGFQLSINYFDSDSEDSHQNSLNLNEQHSEPCGSMMPHTTSNNFNKPKVEPQQEDDEENYERSQRILLELANMGKLTRNQRRLRKKAREVISNYNENQQTEQQTLFANDSWDYNEPNETSRNFFNGEWNNAGQLGQQSMTDNMSNSWRNYKDTSEETSRNFSSNSPRSEYSSSERKYFDPKMDRVPEMFPHFNQNENSGSNSHRPEFTSAVRNYTESEMQPQPNEFSHSLDTRNYVNPKVERNLIADNPGISFNYKKFFQTDQKIESSIETGTNPTTIRHKSEFPSTSRSNYQTFFERNSRAETDYETRANSEFPSSSSRPCPDTKEIFQKNADMFSPTNNANRVEKSAKTILEERIYECLNSFGEEITTKILTAKSESESFEEKFLKEPRKTLVSYPPTFPTDPRKESLSYPSTFPATRPTDPPAKELLCDPPNSQLKRKLDILRKNNTDQQPPIEVITLSDDSDVEEIKSADVEKARNDYFKALAYLKKMKFSNANLLSDAEKLQIQIYQHKITKYHKIVGFQDKTTSRSGQINTTKEVEMSNSCTTVKRSRGNSSQSSTQQEANKQHGFWKSGSGSSFPSNALPVESSASTFHNVPNNSQPLYVRQEALTNATTHWDEFAPTRPNPDLQIAIIDRNQDDGKISQEDWLQIEKNLLEQLNREMQQTNNTNIGMFDGIRWRYGIKIIQCENMDSLNFIRRFINNQDIFWPNRQYDVIPAKELQRRSIVNVWIPPPIIDDMAVLKILKAQNSMFYSLDWTFINSRERNNRNGKDLYISISATSLERLRKKKGEIRFGTNRLKMILPDEA